jgi:hypothetical protein
MLIFSKQLEDIADEFSQEENVEKPSSAKNSPQKADSPIRLSFQEKDK